MSNSPEADGVLLEDGSSGCISDLERLQDGAGGAVSFKRPALVVADIITFPSFWNRLPRR